MFRLPKNSAQVILEEIDELMFSKSLLSFIVFETMIQKIGYYLSKRVGVKRKSDSDSTQTKRLKIQKPDQPKKILEDPLEPLQKKRRLNPQYKT